MSDDKKLRPGIDPAWWCVPIVIALSLGLLNVMFEYEGRRFEQQFPAPGAGAPAPEAPGGRPEKPDPYAELAEELKKGELNKDAAVAQPPGTMSPYETAVRQHQKGN